MSLGGVAVQTGRWGIQMQLAYSLDFEGGFQLAVLLSVKPLIRGGYTMGSVMEIQTTTSIRDVFPDPAEASAARALPVLQHDQHGRCVRSVGSTARFEGTVSSEYHLLRLTNPNDLWYSGGGGFSRGRLEIPARRIRQAIARKSL